jgi:hypothetical protein
MEIRMGSSDNEGGAEPVHKVRELSETLAKLNTAPDIEIMHAAILEFLRELGLPADLIEADVLAFRRELSSETDRGAALFAAAHLDERLEMLLRAFLIDDEPVAAPLFSGTGALATFSARIDMAYLTGLIPLSIRRELHLIRRIRNEFAHSPRSVQFANEAIASRCRELTRAPFANAPRERFVQAVMRCGGIIDGGIRLLAEDKLVRCTPARNISVSDPETVQNALVLLAESLRRVAVPDERDSIDASTGE